MLYLDRMSNNLVNALILAAVIYDMFMFNWSTLCIRLKSHTFV